MHVIATTILVTTLCYCIYYFIFFAKEGGIIKRVKDDPFQYYRIVISRIGGFVIFIMPALFTRPHYNFGKPFSPMLIFLILIAASILILLVNFLFAKRSENLAMYPQIRLNSWKAKDLALSSITWILYLTGYEMLFRGYLFFECLNYFDFLSATALNIAIYMTVHIHKGAKEVFGAIPMGFVLCWITYKTGSIWPAIYLHSLLALSNEWFSIYYSQQIKSIK
jgi:membrane protease YdiL (CAAX protease family)